MRNLKNICKIIVILFLCINVNLADIETEQGAYDEEFSKLFTTFTNGFFYMIERVPEIIKEIARIPTQMTKKIIDNQPEPKEVANLGKQAIVGLPQASIAMAVDLLCGTANLVDGIKPKPENLPNISSMNYLFMTKNNNISVPLRKTSKLCKHPKFNVTSKVVVLVTGWTTNLKGGPNDALITIANAYHSRDDCNFIVIDMAHYVDSLYEWAAFNTNAIGDKIGFALSKLIKYVKIENIHLIGHSLGAHICGIAGKTFTQLTNKTLSRITGLDPARPCFTSDIRLNGLERGDAEFIDVIHTNTGGLGLREAIGDVDFYPNGYHILQPGCLTVWCSHSRSYEFYAESVYYGNEENFIASKCFSFEAYRKGLCESKRTPMGILASSTARGSYFLTTNARKPFGNKST